MEPQDASPQFRSGDVSIVKVSVVRRLLEGKAVRKTAWPVLQAVISRLAHSLVKKGTSDDYARHRPMSRMDVVVRDVVTDEVHEAYETEKRKGKQSDGVVTTSLRALIKSQVSDRVPTGVLTPTRHALNAALVVMVAKLRGAGGDARPSAKRITPEDVRAAVADIVKDEDVARFVSA